MTSVKQLQAKLDYLDAPQIELIRQAYTIAENAHAKQKRDTGETYITHPLAVAGTLADMHMDHESIMAALLHDVIEDTSVQKEFIANKFGKSVAELVDGVTKLSQIEFATKAEAKAESFRKMVLAMSRDIRVILIKLADRLHNMRTLAGVAPSKKIRIARETLEIYAPIANRLGMHEISIELELLSFATLYPKRYHVLKESVEKVRGNRKQIMETIEHELRQALTRHNMKDTIVFGREKNLYSIYRKMQRRQISFTEIMDVYAFRIIVDTVDKCYQVLGIVHSIYKPIPGKFNDYIAIPKFNGYQSLHTTLCGPYGIPVEVQIRTKEMDQMANNGIAAHWLYKHTDKSTDAAHVRAQQWVNNLLEMQQSTGSSLEFIENVKIDLFPDEVYIFTPKGHIMELPRGATAVDFAYAVHTDVGNSCVAARIDRHFSPLSTVLTNGETVAIITAPGAKPNPSWLNFVATAKARSGIRNFLKAQKCEAAIELGKQLLGKALAELSISFYQIPPQAIEAILKEAELKTIEELYESIGLGDRLAVLTAHQIANAMHIENTNTLPLENKPLLVKGAEGVAITFAPCCNPIPGDAIVGYLNTGHGLVIHTESCKVLAKLRQKQAEKCIPVQWAEDIKEEFIAVINIDSMNQRGVLAHITRAVFEADSSIGDISMSDTSTGYSLVTLKLMVRNLAHLERVMQHIGKIPSIVGIIRKTS